MAAKVRVSPHGGFHQGGLRVERRLRVLRLAGALFLARGFAHVSMDMIIQSVGGSKRDLYADFGDKDALFKEVVIHLCNERVLLLQRMPSEAGVLESLRLCAAAVIEIVLAPDTLALHRLFVSEADRLGDTASLFLTNGPHRASKAVAAVISRYIEDGSLRVHDAQTAATLFIDSLIGDLQLRALLGEQISSRDIDEKIEDAVKLFLDGFQSNGRRTEHPHE